MFCSDQIIRCVVCTSASVADENANDVASGLVSGTVTISSVNADDDGVFEFTSSIVDVDALATCLEASDAACDPVAAIFSDAACDPVVMFASSGPAVGPFSNIQIDAAGPLSIIHTGAEGNQWIDTARLKIQHHPIPYTLPNAAQHFNNYNHHPPFGVIPEGGYLPADTSHPSMPSLVGSSDEWTDDDQSIYDQWDDDGYDSDSSIDSIPI